MSDPGERRVQGVVLERLAHTFGGTVALRGLEGTFSPGTLHLVTGPNGSGKSTLLRIIGTTLRPSAGRVRYLPDLDETDVRSELGWVSHEGLLYPDLSGRENVGLAARWHGLREAEVWQAAVRRFGLGRFSERAVRTMSRGQRQRVALARALVHGPSLVLMDEPTTGLDSEGLDGFRSAVREELVRGALVIVVTHQVDSFGGFQFRRWHLERGRWRDDQGAGAGCT